MMSKSSLPPQILEGDKRIIVWAEWPAFQGFSLEIGCLDCHRMLRTVAFLGHYPFRQRKNRTCSQPLVDSAVRSILTYSDCGEHGSLRENAPAGRQRVFRTSATEVGGTT